MTLKRVRFLFFTELQEFTESADIHDIIQIYNDNDGWYCMYYTEKGNT